MEESLAGPATAAARDAAPARAHAWRICCSDWGRHWAARSYLEWRTPGRYGQGSRKVQTRPILVRKLARSALLAPQRPPNEAPA
jgi:hypothetical protein